MENSVSISLKLPGKRNSNRCHSILPNINLTRFQQIDEEMVRKANNETKGGLVHPVWL